MTVYASQIMDDAEVILKDADNVNWSEDELFSWVSECQEMIVLLKPNAYITNAAAQLVEGVLQTIAGIQLISVPYNMGTDGLTIGSAIDQISMKDLANLDPDWTTATASATVEKVMFDEDDPTRFYVYPPQPSSSQGYVRIAQSTCPTGLTKSGTSYRIAITLNDIYKGVFVNYLLFKAYTKDAATSPFASQRASSYYDLFIKTLGRKDLLEEKHSPNNE